MIKAVVFVLFVLYAVYITLCLLQSAGVLKFTEQEMTIKGILTPFYFFIREYNPKKEKSKTKK